MSAAFDMMIVGDDEPVPVIERSWYAATRDEPDAARALSVFLRISSEIMERVYPLYAAMLAASATTQRQQIVTRNGSPDCPRQRALMQPTLLDRSLHPVLD